MSSNSELGIKSTIQIKGIFILLLILTHYMSVAYTTADQSVKSVLSIKSVPSIKSVIQTSCPFVEGTAVYRAWTLHSYWEPNAIFDDRIICIQGQNKNQDNSNINIDSLIESQIAEGNVKGAVSNNYSISSAINAPNRLVDYPVKVYPNPASSVIIISYQSKEDGYFKLYNSIGEVVLTTILSKDITKAQLQIKDIANGLYHYEVEFPNLKKAIGKLTIIK